ncbi:MAG TPA: hypothetical protein VJ912_02210 [Candidatus Nanoarchaeia archaeon]|nr:hypothetical protein [Candidatus Nanoarchaeia archaeon]
MNTQIELHGIKTIQMILEDAKGIIKGSKGESRKNLPTNSDARESLKKKLMAISEICSTMKDIHQQGKYFSLIGKSGDFFSLIDESISYSINDLDKDENPFSGLSLEKLMTTINLVIALLKKWSKELEKH